MKITFDFPFSEAELQDAKAAVKERHDALPLRLLCRREVGFFERQAMQHPDYSDGFTRIERFVVEGYLVQKLLGHVDAAPSEGDISKEGQNGPA